MRPSPRSLVQELQHLVKCLFFLFWTVKLQQWASWHQCGETGIPHFVAPAWFWQSCLFSSKTSLLSPLPSILGPEVCPWGSNLNYSELCLLWKEPGHQWHRSQMPGHAPHEPQDARAPLCLTCTASLTTTLSPSKCPLRSSTPLPGAASALSHLQRAQPKCPKPRASGSGQKEAAPFHHTRVPTALV